MEVFAGLLSIPIEKVGEFSLSVEEEPEPVSSTCVVFAKSEASALLREGWPKNTVLATYFAAMARRVVTLLERIEVQKGSAIHHRMASAGTSAWSTASRRNSG
jgi:activator of 2-hydroxyglutaryl-CoA dehydratase